MQHFLTIFSSFVSVYPLLAYGLLFLGVFWEGEFTLICAGILLHLHIFSFWPMVLATVLAAVVKTLLGYRFGQFLGKKFPHSPILKFLERRVIFFLPRFRERPFWSIVLSKFIYGVNNLALVFAGYVGADRNEYYLAEFLSSAIWLSGMFGLGYFFSHTALSISHNVRNFILIVLLFFVGFMILQKLINLIIELIEEWKFDL